MGNGFQSTGINKAAPFTLKIHRGDGMCLLAMNWKSGEPPRDFVGFAIEYREPQGSRFFPLKNRISFPGPQGEVNPNQLSTLLSPIQKFRWVHFPRNAEMDGEFTYRVTPVFMNSKQELSYGPVQEAGIELRRETYPGMLNVAFTRGFVASQAFVDKYVKPYGKGALSTLLPASAEKSLMFKPTHPKAVEALSWMGFEARSAILELLDEAINDSSAEVRVIAYDLNETEIISRLAKLKRRLKIIVDDSKEHGPLTKPETKVAAQLTKGGARVKRQHMGNLQHNKMIVVRGKKAKGALCGSTNFSWRGLYVQNNHAVILRTENAIRLFEQSFEDFWTHEKVTQFGSTTSSDWNDLKIPNIEAKVTFSPHKEDKALLASLAQDISSTTSSLFFSLAFLYQTKGPIRDAIEKLKKDDQIFCYGISDRPVSGLDLDKPDGKMVTVSAEALSSKVPLPFSQEPTGGKGIRMHHKFLVMDFDQPTARVYFGSYNFSKPADLENGENLLCIADRRIATTFMVESVRMFDHYQFRHLQKNTTKGAPATLQLKTAPLNATQKPWWEEDYRNARKIRDRELFA